MMLRKPKRRSYDTFKVGFYPDGTIYSTRTFHVYLGEDTSQSSAACQDRIKRDRLIHTQLIKYIRIKDLVKVSKSYL